MSGKNGNTFEFLRKKKKKEKTISLVTVDTQLYLDEGCGENFPFSSCIFSHPNSLLGQNTGMHQLSLLFPPTFSQSDFHRKENWSCGLDRSHHFSQQVSLDLAYNTFHTSSLPSFPICTIFLLTYIEMNILKCYSLIYAMEKSLCLLLQNIQEGIVSTFWLFIQ